MKGGTRASVLVWDPLQRLLHWILVAAVALAWWAGEARLSLHSGAGYVALGAACSRILLGCFGSRQAWTLVVLAGLHVAGVLFTSWRHRENLIVAMLTGRKRSSEEV